MRLAAKVSGWKIDIKSHSQYKAAEEEYGDEGFVEYDEDAEAEISEAEMDAEAETSEALEEAETSEAPEEAAEAAADEASEEQEAE